MSQAMPLSQRRVRKAIFPVGGLGTRFLPATKAMPKEMLTVVDKPIIQYAVEEAWEAGIEECIFVTGRGKSAIEDHFDHSYELENTLRSKNKKALLQRIESVHHKPGQIAYIRQQEALGLGHAVWCARNLISDEPVAILLADDLILSKKSCLKQMIDAYHENPYGHMVAAAEVPQEQTSMYGVLDPIERQENLVMAKGMVEKPDPKDAPSNVAVIGRYILDPAVFTALETQGKGQGGEIQLTDAIAAGLPEISLRGYLFEGKRYDCGNRQGWLEANIAFALSRDDIDGDKLKNTLKQYI